MTKKHISLKIKTPLWTGDVDSKSDLLQSTGIIGSLRWWTEVILRGMDNFVCDPAGNDRCPKEKEDGNKKISLYCSACLIFGTTGMRRIFRLEINGGARIFDGGSINIRPDGRNRGWYLGSGLKERVDLHIISLNRDFDENLVLVPLTIVAKWGGVGAKTQHGYGILEIEGCPKIDFNDFRNAIEKITEKQKLSSLKLRLRSGSNNGLPNLKEMFFAKVQFEVDGDDWWKDVDGIKQVLEPKDRRGKIDKEMQQKNNKILEGWYDSGSV